MFALVNNTGQDIRMFDDVLFGCIKYGYELPEHLADIFTLEIIEVNGETRGILNWA